MKFELPLISLTLFVFIGAHAQTPFSDFNKQYANKVRFNKSYWPDKITFKEGKILRPFERKGNEMTFYSEKGKPSIRTQNFEDFTNYALKRLLRYSDFELHVTYDNLLKYKDYFPKKVSVRFEYLPLKDNPYHKIKHRLFRLKANEELEIVNVSETEIRATSNRIKSAGLSSVPIDPFYTDILYKTRQGIRKIINEDISNHEDPMVLKHMKGNVVSVYEVGKDLKNTKYSHIGNAPIPRFYYHSEIDIKEIDNIFPLPFEINKSELPDKSEKITFNNPFFYISEVGPNKTLETLGKYQVLRFKWSYFYTKPALSLNDNILKYHPHDWTCYIAVPKNWEIGYYKANVKGSFQIVSDNTLRFTSSQVTDVKPEIEVRLRPLNSVTEQKEQAEEIEETATVIRVDNSSVQKVQERIVINKKIKDTGEGFEGGFITNNAFQKFKISDWRIDDGDIVTIFLNGDLIYENIRVTNDQKELEFELKKGDNVLEVLAENEGGNPPNTARFEYQGNILKLESKRGQSKKIKFELIE